MKTLDFFKNKTILITGGTGSFGWAAVQRLLDFDLRQIRIFSRDTKKQAKMERCLHQANPESAKKVTFWPGDILAPSSLEKAMEGVDCLIHAAAMKQVPDCEHFPIQAVQINVLGTENVLRTAVAAGVKKIVCLSTDKAAYPISAMGISKAMMEKVAMAHAREASGESKICCTRYGNLMCSQGTVIPLFISQIRSGKPLTITNPAMTRFLMTLDEAVEMVLYALERGEAGDLFVGKSDSGTIGDLAKAVQRLFGETGIQIVGARPGEKLYETMMTSEERIRSQDLGKCYRVLSEENARKSGEKFEGEAEAFTSQNTHCLDVDGIVKKLLGLAYIQRELDAAPIEFSR